jgi:hypothetical protein
MRFPETQNFFTCHSAIWTEFKGCRATKSKRIPGPHFVYGFMTTAVCTEDLIRVDDVTESAKLAE